ncbi:MAG TPA: long-chain N-acyl amino acid synthase [Albitalea sp.]|nr:long-chain N-acyl amino acid synthase [Albitalea sp.]
MHTASEIPLGSHPHGLNPPPSALGVAQDREENETGNTIIGVPFETPHPLRSMLLDANEASDIPDADECERLFKIRAADSFGHRSSASILINRMYATRGYTSTGLPSQPMPNGITLMASEHEDTIGTITVGFDSPNGLHVDDLFREEVDVLRRRGRRVCEFTKLAMDSVVKSKRVLASLFHVAYIYAHRIQGFQNLLIEVNPRHVRYYERMLGFEVKSGERLNRRVNAPAVLLSLDFAHAHAQIAHFGGKPHLSATERSLYPYFFSVAEEAGIVGRLRRR